MVEKVEKVEITSTGAASGVSTSSQPQSAKSLRESMPNITAWIDDLRAVFGKDMIDRQIRRGIAGEPECFYAWENGIEIGTPFPVRPFLTVDEFLGLNDQPPPQKKV